MISITKFKYCGTRIQVFCCFDYIIIESKGRSFVELNMSSIFIQNATIIHKECFILVPS